MTGTAPFQSQVEGACPACSGTWKWLYQKNGCSISRCTGCGLGRAAPTAFDAKDYYTEDYFNGGHSDGYFDYAASEEVLRHEFSRVARVLRRYCRPGARLLEIGCAYGFFLKEARKSFEVHGIEIAEAAVQACHRAGLREVHHGAADEAMLSRIGQVDAIVMLDVIEHLTDPFHTLQACSRHLSPGGAMLITTGDFNSLFAQLSGRHWRLMTPPQHLWFFTPSSIRRIADRLGLELVSCTHPHKIVPVSLMLFQIGRMLGIKPRPRRSLVSRIGVPVNLFDAMRIVLRKPAETLPS